MTPSLRPAKHECARLDAKVPRPQSVQVSKAAPTTLPYRIDRPIHPRCQRPRFLMARQSTKPAKLLLLRAIVCCLRAQQANRSPESCKQRSSPTRPGTQILSSERISLVLAGPTRSESGEPRWCRVRFVDST